MKYSKPRPDQVIYTGPHNLYGVQSSTFRERDNQLSFGQIPHKSVPNKTQKAIQMSMKIPKNDGILHLANNTALNLVSAGLYQNRQQQTKAVKDNLKMRSAYDRQIEDLNETLQRLAREKAAHLSAKNSHKKKKKDKREHRKLEIIDDDEEVKRGKRKSRDRQARREASREQHQLSQAGAYAAHRIKEAQAHELAQQSRARTDILAQQPSGFSNETPEPQFRQPASALSIYSQGNPD